MQSIKQFFDYMNDINFPYVVLRNWEGLPHTVELGEHSDLDLLVYDFDHWAETFPEAKMTHPKPRVQFKLPIADNFIYIDVRHIGDGYYPEWIQKMMINTRQKHDEGFFVPKPMPFYTGLMYHAVHHKNKNSYLQWLGNLTVPEMLENLKKNNVGWCKPSDPTVGKFNQYFTGATSVVDRKDDRVIKKQNGYMEYPLMENEQRILSKVDSKYFPKVFKGGQDVIELEDCGEELSAENLPKNWKKQLIGIVQHLRNYKIDHRDIRPGNLMVKKGAIKLIDFGWARLQDDPPDNPPDCLGHPYRAPWGCDDNFAMRKVIREFEYLEDAYLLSKGRKGNK